MTAETVLSASTPGALEPSPAHQLRRWARTRRRALAITEGLSILDALPAIGFAAGIAGGIGRIASDDGPVWPWVMLAVLSLGFRAVLNQLATSGGAQVAAGVKSEVRRTVLTHIFSGRRSDANGLSAAVEGVEALDGYFARFAALKTAAAVAPLVIIAAAAFASPVAAGILLFTLIPFVIGMALTGMAAANESRRHFAALQKLAGVFIDRVRALPVLIAYQAESRAVAEITRASDELERRTSRVLKIAFLSSGVLEFFAALSVALVAVYCGFNLLRLLPFPSPETLTLTRAFFVLALAPEVYAPLRRLAAAYHDRQAAEAAAAVLTAAADETPGPDHAPVRWASAPALHFCNVEIRYAAAQPVVTGFNLDVAPGSIVALAGPSGSGKSSLLHLLLGLAPLSAGEVDIGGVNLSTAGAFAGAAGWASQAPIVIPGTLRDNIALARRDATEDEIRDAADQVGLTGDLARPIDERGGGLSGGERRRLGLARAQLSQSMLLLLDEPTANLDGETEAELIEVLRKAARGRTTLIATHAPAVLALADKVVWL